MGVTTRPPPHEPLPSRRAVLRVPAEDEHPRSRAVTRTGARSLAWEGPRWTSARRSEPRSCVVLLLSAEGERPRSRLAMLREEPRGTAARRPEPSPRAALHLSAEDERPRSRSAMVREESRGTAARRSDPSLRTALECPRPRHLALSRVMPSVSGVTAHLLGVPPRLFGVVPRDRAPGRGPPKIEVVNCSRWLGAATSGLVMGLWLGHRSSRSSRRSGTRSWQAGASSRSRSHARHGRSSRPKETATRSPIEHLLLRGRATRRHSGVWRSMQERTTTRHSSAGSRRGAEWRVSGARAVARSSSRTRSPRPA